MSALGWEQTFGRLLLDDSFRRWIWQAGATALEGYDLTVEERRRLLALDHSSIERAALGLKRKRLLRLQSALPLTLRGFGGERERLVDAFYSAHPTVPASCAVEVRSFGAVASRQAAALGAAWLVELVGFEAEGHLAYCHDAIDAEGVVLAHLLPPSSAPSDVAETEGYLDLGSVAATVDPAAWTVHFGHDLPAIARWLDEDQHDGVALAQPPEEIRSPGDYLVARRPDPGHRTVVSVTLHPPVDRLWEALDGETPLTVLIARLGQSALPAEAWAGIVRRLAQRGLIALRPIPHHRPWGVAAIYDTALRLVRQDHPRTSPGSSLPGNTPGRSLVDVAGVTSYRRGSLFPASAKPGTAGPGWEPSGETRFGIGLRFPYVQQLVVDPPTGQRSPDCLEVYADDCLRLDGAKRTELAGLRARFPLVPHGLELSLGSVVPPSVDYLRRLAELVRFIGAPYYTEHLAWTQTVEWRPGHLCPVVLDAEALERISQRIELIQAAIGVPLAVENISYDLVLPGGGLAEADFLRALCERTGCGLLVDVTNVVVNAHNHGFDPCAYVERLPPERVLQLHLVGYTRDPDGSMIDAHAETTQSDVLVVARHLRDRGARPRAVILERDQFLPPLDALLNELEEIRQALVI